MTSIVRYRKHITSYTTIELHQSENEQGERLTTELATLDDGFTYISVPEGVTLPVQPEEIKVEDVVLTDEVRESIKQASPHVKLIHVRVVQKIRERYSADNERKYTTEAVIQLINGDKLSDSSLAKRDNFITYRNECVQWGREQKSALGL